MSGDDGIGSSGVGPILTADEQRKLNKEKVKIRIENEKYLRDHPGPPRVPWTKKGGGYFLFPFYQWMQAGLFPRLCRVVWPASAVTHPSTVHFPL